VIVESYPQLRSSENIREQSTGIQFCVYLGPTSDESRADAEAMFEEAGLHTRPAILLLVSPGKRRVGLVTSTEALVSPGKRRVGLVTSTEAQCRVSDAICTQVVAGMTAYFERSDIAGGLVAGIHRLQTAVGPASGEPSPDDFPNVIGN